MSTYRAELLRDSSDWQRNTVRLIILRARHDGADVLMPDGTWRFVEEGQMIDDAGLVLPAEVIEDMAEAIARFQGNVSHGATEAKVLREWLVVERDRVDRVLER